MGKAERLVGQTGVANATRRRVESSAGGGGRRAEASGRAALRAPGFRFALRLPPFAAIAVIVFAGCYQADVDNATIENLPLPSVHDPLLPSEVIESGRYTLNSDLQSIGTIDDAMGGLLDNPAGYIYVTEALIPQPQPHDPPTLADSLDQRGTACAQNHGCLIPSFGEQVGKAPMIIQQLIPNIPPAALDLLGDNPVERLAQHLGIDLGERIANLHYLFCPPCATEPCQIPCSAPPLPIHHDYTWVKGDNVEVVPGYSVFQDAGLYFGFDVEFPGGPVLNAYCECGDPFGDPGGVSSSPLIRDACQGFFDRLGVCEPVVVWGSAAYCSRLDIRLKMNRVRFEIGFIPELPAPVGNAAWTETLFPGAEYFRLTDKFSVRPVLRLRPLNVLYADSEEAAVADTTHDAAIYVEMSCFPDFPAGCELVAGALGYGSCSEFVLSEASASPDEVVAQMGFGNLEHELERFNYGEGADGVAPAEVAVCAGASPDSLDDIAGAQSLADLTEALGCNVEELLNASLSYAKWHWFAAPFASVPIGGSLPVTGISATRGAPVTGWGYLADVTFDFDNDVDRDGVLTHLDNCPRNFNPDQADSDHDRVGNACDTCPWDNRNDHDDDGVCGNDDNCDEYPNPGQENCNEVAEGFHTPSKIWGDACDPVPCPRDVAEPTYVEDMGGAAHDTWYSCGWLYDNELDLRPLASHYSGQQEQPVPVDGVVTSARFCQPNQPLGIECDATYDITDARLADSDCAPMADGSAPCATTGTVEAKEHHFHRMRFSENGNGAPNGPPASLDYDFAAEAPAALDPDASVPASLHWTWNHVSDFQRWSSDANDFLASDVELPSDLEGTLWLHADTAIGTADDVSAGTGTHGYELANNHQLRLRPQTYRCSGGTAMVYTPKWFFLWQTLPDPPHDPLRRDSQLWESNILLALEDDQWGSIDADGRLEHVTDRIGSHLRAEARDPALIWANAVEPVLLQGAGASFPGTIALSPDGSEVRSLVATDGHELMSAGDFPSCAGDAGGPELIASWPLPEVAGALQQPTAVETDGYVYVALVASSRIEVRDQDGALLADGVGDAETGLSHPSGVAIDQQGALYVADTGNDRILRFVDAPRYALDRQWGSPGAGDGELDSPHGLAVSGTGRLYVADTGNDSIEVFDTEGGFLARWGGFGSGAGELSSPADVAVSPSGDVYVADTGNHRVQVFDAAGELVAAFGGLGSDEGQFDSPSALAVDGSGRVYVADTGNDRIQVFSADGTYLSAWGLSGSGDGELDAPDGLAVDEAGRVYVGDSGNVRVQVYAQSAKTCAHCPSGLCRADAQEVCCDLECTTDSECPSGFCDPMSALCALAPLVGSPHATDYVPVLTRMRRGVFVVGGVDPASSRPTGEVWFGRLGAQSWDQVPVGIQPASVLAATYSFATDSLYVLDETGTGEVRLWEHELQSQQSRQLGTWARHRKWNRHWLVVDRDGALLLASSNDEEKAHAIARLDPRAGGMLAVGGVERGHRALLLQPVVDPRGYTLVLQKSQGKCKGELARCRIKRERKAALALTPATLWALGEQL